MPVESDRPGDPGCCDCIRERDRAEVAAVDELAERRDARGVSSDRLETIMSKHSAAFAGARGVG